MNENFEENNVGTQTTTDEEQMVEPQEPTTTQEEKVNEAKVETKTFNQDEVNEIVRKRLEKNANTQLKNYGVNSVEELETLISKGKEHQTLVEQIEQLKSENRELKEKDLFTTHQIDSNRVDDVRTYFKGKELEINADSLAQALATHPEWVKKIAEIQVGVQKQESVDETDTARKRIFGI